MPEAAEYHFFKTEDELHCIGFCLTHQQWYEEYKAAGVNETWFSDNKNKTIWKGITDVVLSGDVPDLMTVTLYLDNIGELKNAGDAYNIAVIVGDYGRSSSNIRFYIDSFIETVRLRKLWFLAKKLDADLYQRRTSEELRSLLSKESDKIDNLISYEPDSLTTLYEQIYKQRERGEYDEPVATGYKDLDKKLDGLYPCDWTIVAGPSSVGKTSLVSCVLKNINLRGIPVCLFSIEMDRFIVSMRSLSSDASLELSHIRSGKIPLEKLGSSIEHHSLGTFYIDDYSDTIEEIEAKVNILSRKKGVKVFGIDYLQLMSSSNRTGNREQELSDIGRRIKRLAKRTRTHIICVASLNFQGQVRDSSALIYSADNIIKMTKKQGESCIVLLDIEKARNNETGLVELAFWGNRTKFQDRDRLIKKVAPNGI